MWVLYSNYRYGWDNRTTGLTLALLGVCSATVQAGLVGRVVSWLGERRGILLGETFGTGGFLVYALAPVGWIFCLGVPLTALWGFAGASAQSLMTRQVSATEQGRLQGAIAAIQGLAHMIGPGLFTGVFAVSIETASGWELPGARVLAGRRGAGERLDACLVRGQAVATHAGHHSRRRRRRRRARSDCGAGITAQRLSG